MAYKAYNIRNLR